MAEITKAKIDTDVQAEAAADYMKMQTNDFTETYQDAARKKAAAMAAAAALLAEQE